VTSSAGISHPGLGAFPPPALQTFPQAVTSNFAIARTRTRSRIMAVVKADGYGHGAITVAQAAIAAGAEWLGTTDIAEASKLRAAGLTVPILTWLNPSGIDAEAAATDQIDVAVGSVDELEALLKHARRIRWEPLSCARRPPPVCLGVLSGTPERPTWCSRRRGHQRRTRRPARAMPARMPIPS
jgi:hypothetical protein